MPSAMGSISKTATGGPLPKDVQDPTKASETTPPSTSDALTAWTDSTQANEFPPASASETTLPSANDPMLGPSNSTQARETPAASADVPMTGATHGMQARETPAPSAARLRECLQMARQMLGTTEIGEL